MSNVKPVQFRPVVSEEVVETLQHALDLARNGEAADVAYAMCLRNGEVVTYVSATEDQFRQTGAVSRLLHRMNERFDE